MIIDNNLEISGRWALKGIDVCILSRILKGLPPLAQIIPNNVGNLVVRHNNEDIGFIDLMDDEYDSWDDDAAKIKIKKSEDHKPLGWTDTSNPHGVGYRIMTEDGIKVFDVSEYSAFKIEEKRIEEINKHHE
jgi:hypothetical protein